MKWLLVRQFCSANFLVPTGISPVDLGARKDKGYLVNSICKIFVVLVLSNPIHVFAEVKVSNIFSSDMIVQRDKPVNVWGTADNGEKVTVSINSQNVSTTAENGKWKVTLKPMKAGGPSDMKITGSNTIEFKNILVGDIWLCGGQSNMDYDFGVYMKWRWDPIIARQYSEIANENSANQSLRVIQVKKVSALPGAVDIPVEDDEVFRGKWQTCSKEVIPRMSAVGFVFAQRLQKLLNIPVGLIDANKGGSFIKFWEPNCYSFIIIFPNCMLKMAFFIPLIAAMGGNVGVQSSAIIVQGLASQSLSDNTTLNRLVKELGVALVNGLILSILVIGASLFLGYGMKLALTVSVALFSVIVVAALIGTFVPLVLNKYKIDPALATGPFITTLNDIIGLFLYFQIGRLILGL